MRGEKLRHSSWYRGVLIIAYILGAAFIFTMWATDTREFIGFNGYYKARFAEMIEGTAYKPFVYRMLIPLLVRGGRVLLPSPLEQFLREGVYRLIPFVGQVMDYLAWERELLPEYLLASCFMYAALLGFLFLLQRLTLRLYALPLYLADGAPLIALGVLPVFFKRGTHFLYDLPALFFFTWGLVLILEERLKCYYLCFALGLLNKETMVLLSLVFALHFAKRLTRGELGRHLGVQVGLLVLVRSAQVFLYWGNPGGAFEFHLIENLRLALRPYWYSAVVSVLSVVLLIGHGWDKKPRFLKQSLWIGVPLVGSYLVMGAWGEIRVFYELFPVLFLLALPTVAEILGWPMSAREYKFES